MELRLLQSFLVLSEELHFGRAAARLFIAQPPLTKQIHQLEKQLGVQLFERHPRGARLTPAGEVLAEEVKNIFAAVDSAVHNVRNAEHSGVGRLVLGASGMTGGALLPRMLRAISDTHPGVDLGVQQFENSSQVTAAVLDGKLDAGHVLLPFEHPDLSARKITSHQPLLAVASDHPFASRDSIHVAELENEGFIIPRRYSGSALLRLIESVCETAGFSPRVVKEAADSYATLALVAGGQGISISVTGVTTISSDVSLIPFADEDLPSMESAIAWRTKNPSQLLKSAVDAVVSQH
ncbi:HTH-type transcriptional regulator BenM [Corynebacterium occultum]|uniref:HTH-type transcriptional regulator BenM n=1 Tax=Corynebacterium occultum TaxID=2675219 RepID=A0A6B8VQ00_9CORY|nr:LysR substrate-binding domain-containing protein [Corynebacterium occultum]QGU06173.1 HTH-type transcriptional regulator BenM [Corynebacterium occultum]